METRPPPDIKDRETFTYRLSIYTRGFDRLKPKENGPQLKTLVEPFTPTHQSGWTFEGENMYCALFSTICTTADTKVNTGPASKKYLWVFAYSNAKYYPIIEDLKSQSLTTVNVTNFNDREMFLIPY